MDDRSYLYLKRKILKLTNIDLDSYKSQQMRRRLGMFLTHTGVEDVVDYSYMLERDHDMLQKLRNFLTINVSEFFRDTAPFEQLRTVILPQLLESTSRLSIWSAGCSRGEEAYSVAITLDTIAPGQNYRILATDIDDGSLKKAKAGGPYSPGELKNVSQTLLRKYFTSSDEGYTVIDRIRQKVDVKPQNLLCDKFERGLDLIICRNVTIYFTEETKRKLNEWFYRSLKNGGVLFIGGTEVMLDATSIGFKTLGVSFYQKQTGSPSRTGDTSDGVLMKT